MKTAIITGASRGIGQATAACLLQAGWQVINLSRSPCPHQDVQQLTLDLSDEQALLQIDFAKLCTNSQQIALIHNAAYYHGDTVQSLTSAQLQRAFDINIKAPMLLNQQLLPLMPRGSSMIYLGSTLSEKAVPNAATYVISKHAVVGMMRATCQDLAGSGIHTCCVCPGVTDTEMLREHAGHVPGLLEQLASRTSLQRLIDPNEIAQVIHQAILNPVLNGSVLHANLGWIEQ